MNWFARFSQVVANDPQLVNDKQNVDPNLPPVAPIDQPNVQPTEKPTSDDPVVDEVVKDFLAGKNVAPMEDVPVGAKTATTKMAGATGHYRHRRFFEAFNALPNDVKRLAREKFHMMLSGQVPLKKIKERAKFNVYSADIGSKNGTWYRALAVKVGNAYIWYFVGTHEAYNRVVYADPPQMFNPPQPEKALPAVQR